MNSANIYLFKVNHRNIRILFGICSKLTIKTLERQQWRRFDVFIAPQAITCSKSTIETPEQWKKKPVQSKQ